MRLESLLELEQFLSIYWKKYGLKFKIWKENQHVVVRCTHLPNKILCNCCHTLIKKDYFNVFLDCILQDLVYNTNTCTSFFPNILAQYLLFQSLLSVMTSL